MGKSDKTTPAAKTKILCVRLPSVTKSDSRPAGTEPWFRRAATAIGSRADRRLASLQSSRSRSPLSRCCWTDKTRLATLTKLRRVAKAC